MNTINTSSKSRVTVDDLMLIEIIGQELFDELENQIKTAASDDRNFLLEIKQAIIKDIKFTDPS